MAAEEFGYEEGTQPAWSAAAPPTPDSTAAAPMVGPGGAAFGVFPAARSARPAPRRSPLDVGTTVLRREPAPTPPPAEMRAYDPTWKERAVDRASSTLERLGFDRAGARRTAQSVLGGPQSNLPLGVGLIDIPIVPSIPFLMQEGYRGTERAMSAAQQGDYGRAAMEYLGAAAAMSPVSAAVPPVAREVGKVLGKTMASRPITAPMAQGQRGVFLGEKLFTPQERAIKTRAEELERQGASPDDVMVQTGLVRDLDGTWSVEISDDKMRLKALDAVKTARQAVANRMTDIDAAKTIRASIDQGMTAEQAAADYKELTGQEPSANALGLAFRRSVEQLDAAWLNASSSILAPIRGLKLKDVIDHPELFKRIPEFAEMQVDFLPESDLGRGVTGSYTSGQPGSLALRSALINPVNEQEGARTVVHELQHAVSYQGGREAAVPPAMLDAIDAETGFVGPRAPGEQMSRYKSAEDEVRARVAEARLGMGPEERAQVYPFQQGPGGMDIPRERATSLYDLSGGVFGTARSRQRGAVDLGPRPIPLSEALSDQPTTLRVLENLPGKRTTVTEQELREQMRRPEVTKAEKDVLERVLSRMEGGSISAQNLVKEVGLETAPYRLEPVESGEFAEYGLHTINRSAGDYNYDTMGRENKSMENARTTIYRSPTDTSADNHFQDPRYFGHTRAFEANGIPHVVEIQSDLVQKANTVLSPEDRLRLEQGNANINEQLRILQSISEPLHSGRTNYEETADELEKAIPALESANEDFKLVFGSRLTERHPSLFDRNSPDTAIDRAIEMLRDSGDLGNQVRARRALNMSVMNFMNALDVRKAENTAKLAERGTAEAQRPMFKNWERRLIREELSRAATPQETPEYTRLRQMAKDTLKQMKNLENYSRSQGLSENEIAALTMGYRTDAEYYANLMAETPQFRPIPPVVRFADADTVAKVEGWPEVNAAERDRLRYAVEAQKRSVEEAEKVYDAVMARSADEDTVRRRELAVTYARQTLRSLMAELNRAGGDSAGRFYKEYQGIYDRYNKEVANYLKSLGGKQVKDEYGVGWWEVPVKPQQRRTQIFGMGGAAAGAGAAGYNAPSLVGEE